MVTSVIIVLRYWTFPKKTKQIKHKGDKMYFPANVSKRLIKTGRIDFNYNKASLFKKYEVGYWDLYQDVNNLTNTPLSGPYKIFRPIFKTSKYDKALRKLNKLKISTSL